MVSDESLLVTRFHMLNQCFASKHLRSVRKREYREVHRPQTNAQVFQFLCWELSEMPSSLPRYPNHATQIHAKLSMLRNRFLWVHLLSHLLSKHSLRLSWRQELCSSPRRAWLRRVRKCSFPHILVDDTWTENGLPCAAQQPCFTPERPGSVCVRGMKGDQKAGRLFVALLWTALIPFDTDSITTLMGVPDACPSLPTINAT